MVCVLSLAACSRSERELAAILARADVTATARRHDIAVSRDQVSPPVRGRQMTRDLDLMQVRRHVVADDTGVTDTRRHTYRSSILLPDLRLGSAPTPPPTRDVIGSAPTAARDVIGSAAPCPEAHLSGLRSAYGADRMWG